MQEKWLQWAIEIQAIAQAGLTYGRDAYDKERYARLREIAAEMVALQTELPVEKVRGLFCNETGYQTPKVDTRAAVFQKDRILLVQEANGTWSLPGGWCDVNRSVAETADRRAGQKPAQPAALSLWCGQALRALHAARRGVCPEHRNDPARLLRQRSAARPLGRGKGHTGADPALLRREKQPKLGHAV